MLNLLHMPNLCSSKTDANCYSAIQYLHQAHPCVYNFKDQYFYIKKPTQSLLLSKRKSLKSNNGFKVSKAKVPIRQQNVSCQCYIILVIIIIDDSLMLNIKLAIVVYVKTACLMKVFTVTCESWMCRSSRRYYTNAVIVQIVKVQFLIRVTSLDKYGHIFYEQHKNN